MQKAGDEKPSEWKFWTWNQYWDDCSKFAKTLMYLKVDAFNVINIIGFNSPEWFISDLAAIHAGWVT